MNTNRTIPKDTCIDSTLKLLTEGYLFIPNRCYKYNTKKFETRLLGQKVICMSGEKAAEIFYDRNHFTRNGVIPGRIQETLFGKKGIQTLDGAAHDHRKAMFMSLMTPTQIDLLTHYTKSLWQINSRRFEGKEQVVLFDEATRILFQAACKWAGVPLKKSEINQRARDMSFMIDAFGAVGLRHWKGRCARNRSECWAKNLINAIRAGKYIAPKTSPLHTIAWHRELDGTLITSQAAAVELINILRPITAIATYITFGALALHMHPINREKIKKREGNYLHMFAQEVRRFYPFGPFLGARVRSDFTRMGYSFKKGTLVFLDIYGTNHDPSIWDYPNKFKPERFEFWDGNPFDFIPQGGGNYENGTRCPGEWITVELLKVSVDFLVNHMEYEVPVQDLSYRLNRIPAIPKSRLILNNVKVKKHPDYSTKP